MDYVAKLEANERKELFEATAGRAGMRPTVVEKDFWVCYMLKHLFNDCKYNKSFVFKGGTSLSKAYHLIERFSEDIDLILDWRNIITDNSNPWSERSKTKQDQYNKKINKEAAEFYRNELVPTLNKEISNKLGKGNWFEVDAEDEMIVNFLYPSLFDAEYIVPHVKLEIGPLAEWTPSHITTIEPFAAEWYPKLFKEKSTDVLTIDAERAFWEKITILHKLAKFLENKVVPSRYSRHLYDVYCLGNSKLKEEALKRKKILEDDIVFKQKFYYAKSAHYETATIDKVMLVPRDEILKELEKDYKAMGIMFYGDVPEFNTIIEFLKKLESEIHGLK